MIALEILSDVVRGRGCLHSSRDWLAFSINSTILYSVLPAERTGWWRHQYGWRPAITTATKRRRREKM